MEYGVLRVSETATGKISATKAAIFLSVKSETLVFGNAAVAASEDLKAAIDDIIKIDGTVEVETVSVNTESSTGVFGKNATALYTVKLTVVDFAKLGAILGICSEGKKISVKSLKWEYDDEAEKLRLIKAAVTKAKHKAEQMMEVIGYRVAGIRSCSDSYKMPNLSEIVVHKPVGAEQSLKRTRSRAAASPNLNIGVQFQHKQDISATCTVEFIVKEND